MPAQNRASGNQLAGKLEKPLGAVRTVEELADRIEGRLRGDEREKPGAPV